MRKLPTNQGALSHKWDIYVTLCHRVRDHLVRVGRGRKIRARCWGKSEANSVFWV